MFNNEYVLRDDGNFHQGKEDYLESLELQRERSELQDPIFLEEEPEPYCECLQTDVDYFDSSYCSLHGPGSELHRRALAQEAEAEAAAAARIPYLLGVDWEDDAA